MAERSVRGQTTARRLRGYEAKRRELTDAFNLPDDTRVWLTVRIDTDPDTEDHISIGGSAGRTNTTVDMEIPADLRRALEKFLDSNRGEMEHQLKMDLATNLLASMSGAFGEGDEG